MKKKDNDDLLSRMEQRTEDYLKSHLNQAGGCSKCGYRGYTLSENKKATHCECWFERVLPKWCKEANIPSNFMGKTLEDDWNLKQDANKQDVGADSEKKVRIKRQMSQYIQNLVPLCAGLMLRFPNGGEIQNLILIGEHRSGKTLLASIVAQEAIKKGLITTFINWIDLEPVFSDFECREEQNSIVDDCKNSDILIIDGVMNLGINNPYYLNGLERIASARINSGKPTVITAFEDYTQIRGKHNWVSLIASCQKIYLPPPKNTDAVHFASPNKPSPKELGNYRTKASETE